MFELIERAAARDADAVALVGSRAWTYGELAATAQSYARGLREQGVARFAVVTNDVPVAIALLAASSLVGAEACLYAPDIAVEELQRQAAAFEHTAVFSDREDVLALDGPALCTAGFASLDVAGDDITDVPAKRPLLTLTTGTTGTPRGVRHDWGRQLSRVLDTKSGAGQVWLLAYGPQQFAGLQIILHTMAAGTTLVTPPVRRPQAVVDALHAEGVTHISATPTFWRFLLAELRADSRPAPAIRQITLGGEASPAALLVELAATFPEARVSHIYAGSEFGSTGSVRDGRDGLPASLLTRDDGAPVRLKVEDGQLFVRSQASMVGYYGEPDLDPDAWWPTGDLVEIVDDRILFRGRASDVINVGGVKVHPLPVEERVTAVPGVQAARVYGRANALVGAVVAIDVVADGSVDEAELKKAVRAACADLPRPWQPRSVQVVAELAMKENKVIRGTSAD
ncbi:class I adenylate-forming enzyme family protein [Nocardioides jejuensis]|uniref:Long-chain fatty acid--CoA ligase n=1 Tax=Nocardioides jejuensis TaxID=2502782 RepID=A0A4R1CHE5_9ACTN|nr:class I adenylate-forming enzyme family protein [Nocardioides jejuensis]TCJ30167.1 long-chain fatty acid--CoA ligase [Nocardioides jejuensis]